MAGLLWSWTNQMSSRLPVAPLSPEVSKNVAEADGEFGQEGTDWINL